MRMKLHPAAPLPLQLLLLQLRTRMLRVCCMAVKIVSSNSSWEQEGLEKWKMLSSFQHS
jgi:hypothetical protein